MKKYLYGTFLFCLSSVALADAPVLDYSRNASEGSSQGFSAPSTSNISDVGVKQRLSRIENQVNNFNDQNLSVKFDELQQKIQSLNGQVELQNHKIEQLTEQLKSFYKDLDKRIVSKKPSLSSPSKPKSLSDAASSSATTAAITASGIVPATAKNVAGAYDNKKQQASEVVPAADKDKNMFFKEQQMYQTAIDLLPDRKNESEQRLRDYLKKYPNGIYVANAHYWLGEINFLQKNFDAAEEEFKIVINKYSKSRRVPDAMLKLALVHRDQGREDQAKTELNQIIKTYPGSPASQLAKQQLKGK